MKLFVWNNPYFVSYGCSMVFAVAETEEAAREAVARGQGYSYGEYPEGSRDWSGIKLGKPSRVVDCPCAEWHRWQE